MRLPVSFSARFYLHDRDFLVLVAYLIDNAVRPLTHAVECGVELLATSGPRGLGSWANEVILSKMSL